MNNELNKQCTIVLFKIVLFFLSYLLLVAFGCVFVYVAYYCFMNYGLPGIMQCYDSGEFFSLLCIVLLIALPCCFLLLYGLYPLKFLLRKSNKSDASRVEVTKEKMPKLFTLIEEVAKSTGCKMPLHVFLSNEVNASVFYNNTLQSIFFPTRKNLVVGLGLFVNTNTEEVKSIIAHEFGHFAQSSMKIGSVIYYLNTVMYDMAFQEDRWDAWLDKYFRGLMNLCRFGGWYGVIGQIVLFLLYHILVFVKDVLRWMYKFVNRSYYSLSRQMEFDADRVACSIVGKEMFVSAMIKVSFASVAESNAVASWRRLLSVGKYAPFYDVFAQYEKVKAEELCTTISYDKIETCLDDFDEEPSEITFTNLYSDHPSEAERIEKVQSMPSKQELHLQKAWDVLSVSSVEEWEKLFLCTNTNETQRQALMKTNTLSETDLVEWIKQDYEGVCLPKFYRPFFEMMGRFDLDSLDVDKNTQYPFTEANRTIMKAYKMEIKDAQIMHQLQLQDEIKYATYRGKVYAVSDLPCEEKDAQVKELSQKHCAIQQQMYSYLAANSEDSVKAMYEYLFAGMNAIDSLNALDEDIDKLRERYMHPYDDDEEPDDYCDLKIELGGMVRQKLKPIMLDCSTSFFELCAKMGCNQERLNAIVVFAQSETPDYTNYDIKVVLAEINRILDYRKALKDVLMGMIGYIKGDLVNIAQKIEQDSEVV